MVTEVNYFEEQRAVNTVTKNRPQRAVDLGFVDLVTPGHLRPKPGVEYNEIASSNDIIGQIPFPTTRFRRLDLNLYSFYCKDLPDIWGSNEGLVKVSIDTRSPQEITTATDMSIS